MLTLSEALSFLLNKGLTHIILDIKDGPPFGSEGFADAVLSALSAARCEGAACIVWAKDDGVVAELLARGGGARAGFVLMNETAEARARGMGDLRGRLRGASFVAAHWAMVDAPLVAAAARRGLSVFGWTANAAHMIDPLIRAGVAAIVTDAPTLVQSRIDALRAAC